MAGVSIQLENGDCVVVISEVNSDVARICRDALNQKTTGEKYVLIEGRKVVEEKPAPVEKNKKVESAPPPAPPIISKNPKRKGR